MVQVSSGKAKVVALALAAATAFPAMAQEAKTIAVQASPSLTTQALTTEQCRVFKTAATKFMQIAGRENLSDAFVSAIADFAITKKCTGPAGIPTDGREIATFNSISGTLYVATGADLDKIGVRQVKRTASLQGGPQ